MFPNGSCLKCHKKNQFNDTYFGQSSVHSNIGLALQICFVLQTTLSHGLHPFCAVRTSSQLVKPNATHKLDLRRVGSVTHARNKLAFVLKLSSVQMFCIPMLIVGRLRLEPTIAKDARRALHHLGEISADFRFLVAPSLQSEACKAHMRTCRLSHVAAPCTPLKRPTDEGGSKAAAKSIDMRITQTSAAAVAIGPACQG